MKRQLLLKDVDPMCFDPLLPHCALCILSSWLIVETWAGLAWAFRAV